MDTSIKPRPKKKQETRTPLAFKCSLDGKFFVYHRAKKCRYCVPVYDQEEIDNVPQDYWRD